MWRAGGFALLILAGLFGCRDLVGPEFPGNARPMPNVPIQYATWWHTVEACSGRVGDLSTVDWYYTDGVIRVDGQDYDGYWFESGNRIVISNSAVYYGSVVRHEMLHALLRSGGHPRQYFVDLCGAVAPCGTACSDDETARGVPASARVIPTESLTVSIALAPAGAPAISIDSGWTMVMVTATNTRPEPVWVMTGDETGFGYVFATEQGTARIEYQPRLAFRAGESRSMAFDFQKTFAGAADTIWGVFGHKNSQPIPFVVGQ
jgi:hypothetical protein